MLEKLLGPIRERHEAGPAHPLCCLAEQQGFADRATLPKVCEVLWDHMNRDVKGTAEDALREMEEAK